MSSKSPNLDDLSFDAVIPSVLLLNENIEPNAIKLYAFIRGLTKSHGYCFATNEYLSKCMKCDESSVRRLLASLKSEGFVKIITNKQGMHWQRHIYVGVDFNKSLRRLKNKHPTVQNNSPPRSKLSTIYKEEYIKEDKDKERKEIKERSQEGASPLTPPPSFFSDRRVVMDRNKYENLIRDFGKEKIDEMIDRLDEYADLNRKRFNQYSCHAAVIRKWIREDKMKNPAPKKTESNQTEKNKKLAECVAQHFPEAVKRGFVEVGYNYVEFRTGPGYCSQVKFSDHGFVDQVLGFLRKMGASVDAFLSKIDQKALGMA